MVVQVFMDFLVPGPDCSADFPNTLSYHFAFFREVSENYGGIAELLIDDEVSTRLRLLQHALADRYDAVNVAVSVCSVERGA